MQKEFYLMSFLILLMLCPVFAQQKNPDWVNETNNAAWKARDSQGEVVYKDKLWILGGWFTSYEAPPRDVWCSGDGRTWKLITESAPWIHSDLPSSIVYKGRMWMMGGWYNGRLEGHSAGNQVWLSKDGREWKQFRSNVCWKERHEHSAFVFRDKIWVAGGMAPPLVNDVWSLYVPEEWFKGDK